jgi:ADP-heptose:LPS heptosyltransferase
MNPTPKILIFCLPGIGDTLMATPMIALLRKKFPAATIDVCCMFDGVRYVLKNNINVNTVHKFSLYKGSYLNALKELLTLRKKGYDISILAFPAYRREYHIVQRLVGAKKRIAHSFSTGLLKELNFLDTDLVPVNEKAHNVINNLNILNALGIEWDKDLKKDDISYDLVLDPADAQFGKTYLQDKGWDKGLVVGIHPGSTTSSAAILRRWAVSKWAVVAKGLIKEMGAKIIVFAGPDEIDLGKHLHAAIDDNNNVVLLDDLSLGKALGVLSNIQLLLASDNGFGHLANGLGLKTISLFAVTNEKWSGPYNKKYAHFVRPKKYQPWHRYEFKRGVPKGNVEGMKLIEVEDVLRLTTMHIRNQNGE